MSNDAKGNLTVEDLEKFLSSDTKESWLDGYVRAAAVLSAFDPLKLNPVDQTKYEHEQLLECLLPLCEPIVQGSQRGLWNLLLPERREALRKLASREQMKRALTVNPDRSISTTQLIFERMLETTPLEIQGLSRDELVAVLECLNWLQGIIDNLPKETAVRQALSRVDLLAPMERLAGRGFVGRKNELEQLRRFVFGPKADVPLFIFGSGGVGKSTLIARFVLEQEAKASQNLGIVYLDIDRPILRPERPATLLMETVTQLQAQFDLPPGSADSLIKEITYSLAREEESRHFESLVSGQPWLLRLFKNAIYQWLPEQQPILIVVDTLEEAQFLGSDVVWPLVNFLLNLNQSSPQLRLVLLGRTLPPEFISEAFPLVDISAKQDYVEQDLEAISYPQRPVSLSVLEHDAALELLETSLAEAGAAPITTNELNDVVELVGRNPMVLKLAARLLREEGAERLRTERSGLFAKLKAEKIQALLYGRILRHLHNEDVRKVAYPGLIVRRIEPALIRDVLAEPCKLTLTGERNEYSIFYDLSKEAALVYMDQDGSLRHRSDVRRSMLEDMEDHVPEDVVEDINRRTVRFYQQRDGAIARAEEIYHLLRLRESEDLINSRWDPDAAIYLQGAIEEVFAEQRLWLAERLNVTLHDSVRQAASLEAWERQAKRSADRYLYSKLPMEALRVLHERSERSARSDLYLLEAEAYRFLSKYDDALKVARAGVESASSAGAIDMALELLLKMVVIEEARGDLEAGWKLLMEATDVSVHSSNTVSRLRVDIMTLRLSRQLWPDKHAERDKLRQKISAMLNDDSLRTLREHPVLLRELAAELAKHDARIGSAALESLGVEVATDAQAVAFGKTIFDLRNNSKYKIVFDKWDQKTIDSPDEIRKWATRVLTRRDTRELSNLIASEDAGSEILGDIRDYFRVSVDNALKGEGFE